MQKLIKSFGWAKNGIRTVMKEERNFRIQIIIAVLVVLAAIIKGINGIDWALLIIAIAMVLGAEILNTAVEDTCNKIEPNTDPTIGKIKDIMAGFVLVSSVAATLIGLIVFLG